MKDKAHKNGYIGKLSGIIKGMPPMKTPTINESVLETVLMKSQEVKDEEYVVPVKLVKMLLQEVLSCIPEDIDDDGTDMEDVGWSACREKLLSNLRKKGIIE